MLRKMHAVVIKYILSLRVWKLSKKEWSIVAGAIVYETRNGDTANSRGLNVSLINIHTRRVLQ